MIKQIFNVSDEMRLDCYALANMSDGNSESIYYTIRDLVNKDKHALFVLEDNGTMRGFVLGYLVRDIGRVMRIYVDKRFQRQGIGTALLRAYEEYAQKNGAGRIVLQSRATQQAKNFYAKNGYLQISADRFMEKTL